MSCGNSSTRAHRWRLRYLLMPWVLTLADVVMPTGRSVGHVHPGATTLGPRLVPFYPPVDTASFKPDAGLRAAARDELGIPSAAPLIGTVANLTPQKGLEHFITVADKLHTGRPDVQFVILGSAMETHGVYEATIRRMVLRVGRG